MIAIATVMQDKPLAGCEIVERDEGYHERGLRDLNASATEFAGLAQVLEALASLPSPEEVLAMRPSAALQARVEELLAKNRTAGLSDSERREWEQYQYADHLVRMAKAQATVKLAGK
jgi:hypothetical protein